MSRALPKLEKTSRIMNPEKRKLNAARSKDNDRPFDPPTAAEGLGPLHVFGQVTCGDWARLFQNEMPIGMN